MAITTTPKKNRGKAKAKGKKSTLLSITATPATYATTGQKNYG